MDRVHVDLEPVRGSFVRLKREPSGSAPAACPAACRASAARSTSAPCSFDDHDGTLGGAVQQGANAILEFSAAIQKAMTRRSTSKKVCAVEMTE